MFLMTQYLQVVLGYDALGAGLRTCPWRGGLIIAGPLSAKLGERLGAEGRRRPRAWSSWPPRSCGCSGVDADSGYGLIGG